MSVKDFEEWWDETGSGMKPVNGADHEEHAHRMCRVAWVQAEITVDEEKGQFS